jgi:hypothetical protein
LLLQSHDVGAEIVLLVLVCYAPTQSRGHGRKFSAIIAVLAHTVVARLWIYSVAAKNYESRSIGYDDVAFQSQQLRFDQLLQASQGLVFFHLIT